MSDDRRQLVSRVVEQMEHRTLDQLVADLREQGNGWRPIARHLKDRFDVSVPYRTLARWYEDKAS